MIRVDGVEIPEEALALEAQLQDAADPTKAWEAGARALVVRQLLLAEAERQGLAGPPDMPGEAADEAAIRRLLEANLHLPEPTEDELRRWYENNRARLRRPDAWRAEHILIAAPPDDAPARAAARQTATRLLAEVRADPKRLPELARRHSDCPSRHQGGDLGLVEQGSSTPELEARLAALEPGEVSPDIVESRWGIHVVRLLAREAPTEEPFEAVRAGIAEFLREASWRRAVQGYIAMLAGSARIEGFDLFAGEEGAAVRATWPAGAACTSAAADRPPAGARPRPRTFLG